MNFDQLQSIYTDIQKAAWEGPVDAKTADNRMVSATVIGPYDAETNTCKVRLHLTRQQAAVAGSNRYELSFPIRPGYQGPTYGAGSAFSLTPGQPVHIFFENGISSGLQGKGVIDLAYFTNKDKAGPRAASFANPETSGGWVMVHGTEDGRLGNVEHVDPDGNAHVVRTGVSNAEDWGNRSAIHTGPSQIQSAASSEKAAASAQQGADRLKGA